MTRCLRYTARRYTTLIILSLSIITFQSNVSAESKVQITEDYRLQGYIEFQKGNIERALTFYAKALAVFEDAPIYNDIGVVYEQLGYQDKAEYFYQKALRLNKTYPPAYMNLAYLYKVKGNWAKALEYFQLRIYYSKSKDYWTQQASREINEIKDYLIRTDPEYRQRYFEQEALNFTEDIIHQAHQEFNERLIRSNEYYQKGKGNLKQKNYSEAIAEFDKALIFTPLNPNVLRTKRLAEFEKIKSEISQHSQQAMDKLNAGDVDSAEEEFRKILTKFSSESQVPSE